MELDVEQATSHGAYRVTRAGDVHEVYMKLLDRWEAMYRFTLVPQTQGDYEMANWFTSAHPKTRFTRNLVMARVVGRNRVNLLNASLSIRAPDGSAEHRVLSNAGELEEILVGSMGIRPPLPAAAIWDKLPAGVVPQWP